MQNPNHPPGKNIPTLHTKPSPPKRNNIHLPNLKHDQRKEQYQFQHSKLTEELTKQRHTSQVLRNEFKSKHRGENNSVIIPGGPGQQARVEISKEHKELHDMIRWRIWKNMLVCFVCCFSSSCWRWGREGKAQEGRGRGEWWDWMELCLFSRMWWDECLTSLNNQHNNQHPEFAQCFSTAIHVTRTILPKQLWRGATAALLIYLNWNAIILGNVLSDNSGEAIAFSSSTTATNPIHLIRNTQLQSGRANAEPKVWRGFVFFWHRCS